MSAGSPRTAAFPACPGASPRHVCGVLVLLGGLLGMFPGAAQAQQPAPTLPAINLPLSLWTVIAQARGFLAEAYAPLGTRTIRLVDPGSSQLGGTEAALLDRGGLALAQRMMYPAAVHKANGIDARVVWLSGPSTSYRTPVLARTDSPVRTVADLRGQALGANRISCGWTSPTEILSAAGVPLDIGERRGAVRFTNISSTVANTSALLSGRIEAISTHIALPDAAGVYLSGQVKVIGRSPEDGIYVNAAGRVAYFAMRDFAERYPEAIVAFLRARERTIAWVAQNPDAAAAIVARETRVPVAVARFELTDPSAFEFIDGEPSADAARGAIKAFQAWYIAQGDDILGRRPLSDDVIEGFVDGRFFRGGSHSVYQ
ncbi:ABC transporter substrate-binding protein [Rhodovastum atsumiense]|uniref:ABC transporter substrate-binding protein n=1 Tax=Rhodovastum atsumiense TaxID=504468 RepID=A0A5M6J370_9PROT|nr:ABC transporter substrate-binding protein [Rhodovastum atsumiense]KAA5614567.1 ABC transporter substrate-binding protein [Rhodovastum atsumiense]CAH2599940.1 ABC transporter substrate-binding protein [Rhodovastum atsumiense]